MMGSGLIVSFLVALSLDLSQKQEQRQELILGRWGIVAGEEAPRSQKRDLGHPVPG